jgi:hypothetical protein
MSTIPTKLVRLKKGSPTVMRINESDFDPAIYIEVKEDDLPVEEEKTEADTVESSDDKATPARRGRKPQVSED